MNLLFHFVKFSVCNQINQYLKMHLLCYFSFFQLVSPPHLQRNSMFEAYETVHVKYIMYDCPLFLTPSTLFLHNHPTSPHRKPKTP